MTLRFTLQALTGASALLIGGHLFDDAKGAEKNHRAAYYKDGEIHVNILGAPEVKPITQGHWISNHPGRRPVTSLSSFGAL